jgi:aarF domain-containing kinase
MRLLFSFVLRPCRHPSNPSILRSIPRHQRSFSILTRRYIFQNPWSRSLPSRNSKYPRRILATVLAGAALSPATFLELSTRNSDGKTVEEAMLEASRNEIRKEIPEDVHGIKWAWKRLFLSLDLWIYEPICTGLRFLHLVVIFVPVIVCIPAIWVGSRVKDRDNEMTGTLWWYGFLVGSMERAGPAFIKVSRSTILREMSQY